jgi:hypothetical protein
LAKNLIEDMVNFSGAFALRSQYQEYIKEFIGSKVFRVR